MLAKKDNIGITEVYSEPCQTSEMDHFGKTVNGL